MFRKALLGTAVLLVLATGARAEGPAAGPPMVHIVLKFVKESPGASPVALDPGSCPACIVGHDPAFARDNARETLIELRIPARRALELAFAGQAHAARRAILETADLVIRSEGDRLVVALPPLATDMIETGEFATHIVEPGMVLRLEHADPAQLAGFYAGKPLPAVQRAAASHLEFAEREAVRELGLGDYVAREGLGIIEIMGFDTNDPHGHTDAPPHFHMHLRWPFNIGTQIGHFYINPQGLLDHDTVGVTGYRLPTHDYRPGEAFTTIDNRGHGVYAQTITAEGWLKLASVAPGLPARSCLIRPVAQGFDSGAQVACEGFESQTIHVQDDLAQGVLHVATGPILETFRYDRDTGRLLSPAQVPAVPESVIVPMARTTVPLAGVAPGPAGTGAAD
jgi:hypothetical protein